MYSFVRFILRPNYKYPALILFLEANGFRLENNINGPNINNIMANNNGTPIINFFHHSILLPIIFPCKKSELHLAIYILPNIYSNLIQSNNLNAVLVNVQSENTLN